MSIESNVYDRLMLSKSRVDESVNYQFSQSVASEIANSLPAYNFSLAGLITDEKEVTIPVLIDIRLNSDDIEAVESDNVVYVFLNTDKIDYSISVENPDNYYYIKNFNSVMNSRKRFLHKDEKCWRDESKLYLLKMNRNSGIVSRFNRNTGTFNRQMNDVNYNSATNSDIAKNLLTVDYLSDYLGSQLIFLKPMIDPMTDSDLVSKRENELESVVRYKG